MAFIERRAMLVDYFRNGPTPRAAVLTDLKMAKDPDQLAEHEAEALKLGYEGLIARNMLAPYKFGRSTIGNSEYEGGLIKIKRAIEYEAIVIGFEELMRNGNESKQAPDGSTARSTHQANLIPANTLGAIHARGVNGPFKGREFRVGVFKGVGKDYLKRIWDHRDQFMSNIFTYLTLPYGVKDLPVQPRWTGWRSPLDMNPE
jgi:DNA ligase-1